MGQAQAADGEGLEPWASNHDPTDVARRHVEDVSSARHEYAITQGGTMDGQNCRSPFGVFEGVEIRWESNRAVRIENVGETDVVNPWLSNGRNNFRTIHQIAQAAIEPGMSDGENGRATTGSWATPCGSITSTATTRAATTPSAWPASGPRRA